MDRPPLVVIGASTGGVEALSRVCAGLPADFPAAVFLVLHVDAHESMLPGIIARRASLPVSHALHGERIAAGHIYVAPPDLHMHVQGDKIALERGPKEHHTRPAIDPLFRSAAASGGSKVAAVVLTGDLNDGTLGLRCVKQAGGVAIVQDPEEAVVPTMPLSAMARTSVDLRAPLDDIPAFLCRWVRELSAPPAGPEGGQSMISVSAPAPRRLDGHENDRTIFVCPSCKGSLRRAGDGDYRCYVGHRFTLETLAHAQSNATDDSLWSAYRALCEKTVLLRLLAEDAKRKGAPEQAAHYEEQVADTEQCAEAVRELTRRAAGALSEAAVPQ
ncbi:chemotaxis protein CheB [Luteibacter sp. NPDC031894]|uniref:chemotaxis protein CheB n=1 Tax=Luteibacter sp. NPDC031894 TaxID=3390572 RepID=UPI003D031253